MKAEKHILTQVSLHPSMKCEDLFKMLYQAAFGREHLLSPKAMEYLESEYEEVEPSDGILYEQISDDYIRVNLGAWKGKNLPVRWLGTLFLKENCFSPDSRKLFFDYLYEAENMVIRGEIPSIGYHDFIAFRDRYLSKGPHAIHHSDYYREKEKPHYRVLPACYSRVIEILAKVSGSRGGIIAIDGRAASGKSTIADILSSVLSAPVIHMDDFFLPLEKRTPERLSEAGGNLDYERFSEEVISSLSSKTLSYGIFDCSEMRITERREIKWDSFLIVEGSYSHHPSFGHYADLSVFSDIDPALQKERILRRNGERMLDAFVSRWIPMEEKYFTVFDIRNSADIVL